MARGDAPLEWSDNKNVAWRANIPGRGFSSPVIWSDKIFLTTAVPTGDASTTTAAPHAGGQMRGPGGGAGIAKETIWKFQSRASHIDNS